MNPHLATVETGPLSVLLCSRATCPFVEAVFDFLSGGTNKDVQQLCQGQHVTRFDTTVRLSVCTRQSHQLANRPVVVCLLRDGGAVMSVRATDKRNCFPQIWHFKWLQTNTAVRFPV